jgi:hypothetical protein
VTSRASIAGVMALGVLLPSRMAFAEVSSWLYVGAGPTYLLQEGGSLEPHVTLQLATGLGTSPANPLIVGGLFRTQTHFGSGTDLSVVARAAMQSYVNGDWGAALDLGPYRRWWGVGSTGGLAAVSLGAPWGLTLDVTAARGTNEASHYTAVFGVDFARLTVYRTSGNNWWSNPFPAHRPE